MTWCSVKRDGDMVVERKRILQKKKKEFGKNAEKGMSEFLRN